MIRTIAMLVSGPGRAHRGYHRFSLDASFAETSICSTACSWSGAWSGVRLTGVRVKTVGLDQLDPARTYIFMSNHASNLDPPITIPLIPKRTSVMVKKELFKFPILGRAMRMGSLVPVDRGNRDAGIESVKAAKK